jgi:NADH:ubiquinone oxidoreductase subunit 5 (subunit L)/multisubunit Na+/H+ antiporter MnhA subunit
MSASAALWALVLLPLVAGVVLSTGGRYVHRWAAVASIACTAAVLVLSIVVAVVRPSADPHFVANTSFGLVTDGLSALMLVTVAAVTLLVLTFAAADVRETPARFHGLMLVFEGSVLVTLLSSNLVSLLAAWEVMGATSYALIGYWWQDEHRVASGAVAFVTTRAADLGLYAAVGAALASAPSLDLADLPSASGGWRHVIAGGVLIAALGKAAQLPFSFWLSRAMEGPSPVSALLHSAAMVAMGGYLLLRVAPLLAAVGWAGDVAAWIGALTTVALGLVAVAQRDLKQLLAASTAAQLGFVVAAAGVGAVAGGTAHLVAHAATKAALFLAAGAWLQALGSKQLVALRGGARRWPVVGAAATVALLALAGVPPLALWATKDDVLASAREASPALYVVLLVGALLSAAYAGLALAQVWRAPAPDTESSWDDERPGTRTVALLERAPIVVLALGAAVLELLVLPPFGDRLRTALGAKGEPTAGADELAATGALALLVVAAVALLVGRVREVDQLPAPKPLVQWLCLEAATQRSVVRPVRYLAGWLSRFDDQVLDAAVMRTAAVAAAVAQRAERFDERGVDAGVTAVARGARRAGRLAVRPQTGQLHEYYLQAVAVLAVAFVLLIVVR